ncbi:uncharacterized protein EV420DRAFT_1502262 [Desarmillaria tabescens]|uniref:GS catalytic domain-containing protein n=1 Tax=Armillaria tabescens TaxID=1929756 RepID=A0AA39NM82_ARMTA|nr:uncharacterized protein EV420DRAFT_1502262 [Desarmillaria tabescens]KAK0467993.1 hypothetical protein EV420DRAFT_1502262 [Desarmillaria tabescens]
MSISHIHGVQYTPSTVSNAPRIKAEDLETLGIAYVCLTWMDLTSLVRYRVIPVSYFLKMLQSPRPGAAVGKCALGMVNGSIAEDFNLMGEYLYVIDPMTLRLCPYEGIASKAPVLGPDGHLTLEVELCPRTTLHRVVERAREEAGVEFLVGFETEFILLKSTNPIEAVSYHDYSASNGLPTGSVESRVLREISDFLIKAGIEVTLYHPEGAPGQYEIVTGPLLPLEAADALIHTRETYHKRRREAWTESHVRPRVYMSSPGSAAHTHISPVDVLSAVESSFIAGVLKHLPAMTAVTLPHSSVVQASSVFLDGTGNPHLALALILASGTAAILDHEELMVEDCPGPQSAAQLSATEREALGITERVPLDWNSARANFTSSAIVDKTFGPELKVKYLSVNKVGSTFIRSCS